MVADHTEGGLVDAAEREGEIRGIRYRQDSIFNWVWPTMFVLCMVATTALSFWLEWEPWVVLPNIVVSGVVAVVVATVANTRYGTPRVNAVWKAYHRANSR